MKGMEEMGMTDLQFKAFLRGLLADLERVKETPGAEEKDKELEAIIELHRKALED